MTHPKCGGGLGAVPGGPQKCAVRRSGRRPAFLAPFVSFVPMLVSDANGDDRKVVRVDDRRSCGILRGRFLRASHRIEVRSR